MNRGLALAVLSVSMLVAGCQGGKSVGIPAAGGVSVASSEHNLTDKDGKWVATRKTASAEYKFREDGSYDALHQEGEVAAQITGKFRWDNGFLVIDPAPEGIEARSRDAAEANRVQDRLSRGYELAVEWSGTDKFIGRPKDGSEAWTFARNN